MTPSRTPAPRPVSLYNRLLLGMVILLAFVAGVQLYVLSGATERFFAWTIAVPLSAAYIGAGFWSALVPVALSYTQPYWKDFRSSLPAAFTATSLVLVTTLLHLDKFHFGVEAWFPRTAAWVWLIVYLIVPPLLGLGMLVQRGGRGQDPAARQDLPAWMWIVVPVQAALAIGIGLNLFLFPAALTPVWPWALTPLTGRMVGAWLLSVAVAALMVLRENDRVRVRAVWAGVLSFGLLQLLALVRFAGLVSWGQPSAWLYTLYLLSLVGVAALGVVVSFLRAARRAE